MGHSIRKGISTRADQRGEPDMKAGRRVLWIALAGVLLTLPAPSDAGRNDVIWARRSLEPITLDGVLDEEAWGFAESKVINWAEDAGIPGSGWKPEGGVLPNDPTRAALRFLVYENQLYLGGEFPDASVGGSKDWARWDGILMAIKDHLSENAPKPPSEYFYAWWYATEEDPQPPGQDPAFIGRWANWPPGSPRDPEQIEAWDAVTVVHGLSNDDSEPDEGYTIEMRFDLTVMGYDVTQPEGDIIEWNIAVWDCDWFWPLDAGTFSSNRVWWQGPWGNDMWYNEVRVFARPDVTVESGPAPVPAPEMVVSELGETPVIDGELTEGVWTDPNAISFDIRWDDEALRATYPAVGPYRSGQFQPEVNGGLADVIDPADATVTFYHNGHMLYMGFDVRDQVVQYHPNYNRWDGFKVTINDREERGNDNQLLTRELSFQVFEDGSALPQDFLVGLVDEGSAEVAIYLNPGTTVDTLGQQADNGYTAELAVDLTALGYTPDLGDGALFLGINHLDGDSFEIPSDSYGTRTWWFREYVGQCCPIWAQMEGATAGVEVLEGENSGIRLLSNYPNPARRPVIRYALPQPAAVVLEVFDVQGRRVDQRLLGERAEGAMEYRYDAADLPDGMYLYRLKVKDLDTGTLRVSPGGKMVVMQ
ncbi:MAG: T9SS type A sorting domain-containing protein [Candidatus Eisenbacteria bacterium]|nr:T9SS type A sorting domain-containing protein [Candidatus Eisenbacteria bacterium]